MRDMATELGSEVLPRGLGVPVSTVYARPVTMEQSMNAIVASNWQIAILRVRDDPDRRSEIVPDEPVRFPEVVGSITAHNGPPLIAATVVDFLGMSLDSISDMRGENVKKVLEVHRGIP